MGDFDLSGSLRRIRRSADLSQRELASAAGLSVSAVAHAEAGSRDLPAGALARAAAVAGFRLALLDEAQAEVRAMTAEAVRDLGGRRFPAHLDTSYSDERWWRYEHRYDRPRPWFTFDRNRRARDAYRHASGTPEDHHEPRPGDSPVERKARRVREARRLAEEERRRRAAAGGLRTPDPFSCGCPEACDEVDVGERPRHATGCPCLCDLG